MKIFCQNTFIKVILFLTFISCQEEHVFDVRDYGAVADGNTVNTKFIQNAIDDCFNAGGGIVKIEGGSFVTGTIFLRDHVTLHVSEGTSLVGSVNPNDYEVIEPFIDATGQFRGQCLIGAIDVENIAITGKGVIDGQGKKFTPSEVKKTLRRLGVEEKKRDFSHLISQNKRYVNKNIRYGNRPFLVRFVRVRNSLVKDISLLQPAAWTLHYFQCYDFKVENVHIYSHANRNNDGIDIDSSSKGEIKDSHINSGDDAICIKATSLKPTQDISVENCKISSHWGGIKFGTESMGDFKNITIKNCFIYDNKGGGIKILSADGSNIENIYIENVRMENVDMPIFIRLGERCLSYRNEGPRTPGSIKNVHISNIIASSMGIDECRVKPPTGIFITGTPNHKIESIKLSNISIQVPGGGTVEDARKVVPENETLYPEYTKFGGCLPAYGMYARHVKNLEFDNVEFSLETEDQRREVVFEDVNE